MVVAPMTMTSEREEVIDFVAPYFDQSGISIIIRKPVREQSLFKFMQVMMRTFHINTTLPFLPSGSEDGGVAGHPRSTRPHRAHALGARPVSLNP